MQQIFTILIMLFVIVCNCKAAIEELARNENNCIFKHFWNKYEKIDFERFDCFYIKRTQTYYTEPVKDIQFKQSMLTTIPINIFSKFNELNKLSVSNCNIMFIERSSFANANQLQHLNLSLNLLENLSAFTFVFALDLQTIDLSHNKIRFVSNKSFSGLTKLKQLILANNNIKVLEDNVFVELQHLAIIDLSYNKIYTIANNLFSNNHQIEIIHLNNNQINNFDSSLINLLTLNSLDVSNNPIGNINYTTTYLRHINVDDIENNNFDNNTDLFHQCKTNEINLKMQNISANILYIFFCGAVIDASHNNISKIIFPDSFSQKFNFTEINLSNNALIDITNLTNLNENILKSIDLSNNKFKNININDFAIFRSLENLYLNGNNIENEINLTSIEQYFPKLNIIGLPNSNWNCIHLSTMLTILQYKNINVSINIQNVNDNDIQMAIGDNIKGIKCKMSKSNNNDITTNNGDRGDDNNNVEDLKKKFYEFKNKINDKFENLNRTIQNNQYNYNNTETNIITNKMLQELIQTFNNHIIFIENAIKNQDERIKSLDIEFFKLLNVLAEDSDELDYRNDEID